MPWAAAQLRRAERDLTELPDETAFASLVLGTRHRPLPVFAGVAAAFAITGGRSLLRVIPARLIGILAAAAMAAMAVISVIGAIG